MLGRKNNITFVLASILPIWYSSSLASAAMVPGNVINWMFRGQPQSVTLFGERSNNGCQRGIVTHNDIKADNFQIKRTEMNAQGKRMVKRVNMIGRGVLFFFLECILRISAPLFFWIKKMSHLTVDFGKMNFPNLGVCTAPDDETTYPVNHQLNRPPGQYISTGTIFTPALGCIHLGQPEMATLRLHPNPYYPDWIEAEKKVRRVLRDDVPGGRLVKAAIVYALGTLTRAWDVDGFSSRRALCPRRADPERSIW